jgi:uncharacterized protein
VNKDFDRWERLREQQQRQRAVPLEQALGGGPVEFGKGVFYRRGQDLDGHLCHGPFSLAQAATRLAQSAGFLGISDVDLSRALYLDTETTGLAGGSGTYAFLIGLAYFEDGKLRVEQLLMRQHCEEKAMLHYLVERLEAAECLVTFNGKSFDGPLLQTRLMMNRLRFSIEDMPHLDLLPIARPLWSNAFENCRLETLERELLGLPRQGDIPGFMIPQLFFRFLQNGCARGLAQVAEHNRRDMLAMVALVAGLIGYARQPLQWQHRFRQHAPLLHLEDLALAQQLYRRHRFEEAGELLERVWSFWQEQPVSPALRLAGMLLARLHRRSGRPLQASAMWRKMAEWFPQDPEILEQVAKGQEHLVGDWSAALGWVQRALGLERLSVGRERSLLRRRERLQRRLDKSQNAG